MRIDLDCLSIVRDSTIDVPFSPVGGATVVVSAGVPWVDLDRLVIICDCAVDFVRRAIGNAPIVVSIGVVSGLFLLPP